MNEKRHISHLGESREAEVLLSHHYPHTDKIRTYTFDNIDKKEVKVRVSTRRTHECYSPTTISEECQWSCRYNHRGRADEECDQDLSWISSDPPRVAQGSSRRCDKDSSFLVRQLDGGLLRGDHRPCPTLGPDSMQIL